MINDVIRRWLSVGNGSKTVIKADLRHLSRAGFFLHKNRSRSSQRELLSALKVHDFLISRDPSAQPIRCVWVKSSRFARLCLIRNAREMRKIWKKISAIIIRSEQKSRASLNVFHIPINGMIHSRTNCVSISSKSLKVFWVASED